MENTMPAIIQSLYAMALSRIEQEKEMCKEFSRRKELARERYWNACNLPRKKKKQVRKEAKFDFTLYSQLEKPVMFNF